MIFFLFYFCLFSYFHIIITVFVILILSLVILVFLSNHLSSQLLFFVLTELYCCVFIFAPDVELLLLEIKQQQTFLKGFTEPLQISSWFEQFNSSDEIQFILRFRYFQAL